MAQQPPDRRQAVGSVHVDPQPVGVRDVRLGGGALAAHRGRDADLVSGRGVPIDEREQGVEPARSAAGAAGQEVAGVSASGDP